MSPRRRRRLRARWSMRADLQSIGERDKERKSLWTEEDPGRVDLWSLLVASPSFGVGRRKAGGLNKLNRDDVAGSRAKICGSHPLEPV